MTFDLNNLSNLNLYKNNNYKNYKIKSNKTKGKFKLKNNKTQELTINTKKVQLNNYKLSNVLIELRNKSESEMLDLKIKENNS